MDGFLPAPACRQAGQAGLRFAPAVAKSYGVAKRNDRKPGRAKRAPVFFYSYPRPL